MGNILIDKIIQLILLVQSRYVDFGKQTAYAVTDGY